MLGFESEKAANNLLPQLRSFGLIDGHATPTDLAKRYRMDDDYEAATRKLVEAACPEEMRGLFPALQRTPGRSPGGSCDTLEADGLPLECIRDWEDLWFPGKSHRVTKRLKRPKPQPVVRRSLSNE